MAERAIIFDFDGTIADILKIAPIIANNVFRELKMEEMTREDMEAFRELTITQGALKLGIPFYKIPKAVTEVRKNLHLLRSEVEIIKGMDKLIRDLKSSPTGAKLYILTSNSRENVEAFLKKHKLEDCFEEVVSNLTLFNKPRKMKELLNRHAIEAKNAVMVGDELRDIEAGKKNHTRTIAVSWGLASPSRLKKAKPDGFAETVVSLRKMLE